MMLENSQPDQEKIKMYFVLRKWGREKFSLFVHFFFFYNYPAEKLKFVSFQLKDYIGCQCLVYCCFCASKINKPKRKKKHFFLQDFSN